MTEKTIFLKDLRKLQFGKSKSKLKSIEYRESLKDLNIPEGYIALLIIPSFHQKTQDEYLDENFFMHLLKIPEEKDRWNDYSDTIQKTGKLLDEVSENINHFFVCQNYNFEAEWLKDLQFTYKLLENCEVFPQKTYKAFPRLWYTKKANGHILLTTPTEDFIDLCKDREAKLNILFFHSQHINWLKNFFNNHEKKMVTILEDIYLFLIKIK